jgi:hypothetical protein
VWAEPTGIWIFVSHQEFLNKVFYFLMRIICGGIGSTDGEAVIDI